MPRSPALGCIAALLLAAVAAEAASESSIPPNPECVAPTLTAIQFSKLSLDYIIIGSGAGGLPLAARLAEDSKVNVGLIEAGVFHHNDPLIDVPAFGGRPFGNPDYDWAFETSPQANASGRVIQETRGKMLGGSTGINLLAWDRASELEYNAWQTLADNSDWNFNSLLPYFKKAETVDLAFASKFPGPSPAQYAAANEEFKVVNGFNGPIHASYNSIYGDLVVPVVSTLNKLKIHTNPNTFGGNNTGVRNERTAVINGVRSYSVTGYYCPSATRKNFHVITGAFASKIVFSGNPAQGKVKATGVNFISGGATYTAHASREVILAAGSVQTPQLLELSGIGDKAILSPLGIQTIVDLPGVGANLQDHIFVVSQFQTLNNLTTFDNLRNETFLEEQLEIYEKTHNGFLNTRNSAIIFLGSGDAIFPKQDIQSLIQDLNTALLSSNLTPLQRAQFKIQLKWLKDGSVPGAEIIVQSNGLINPANNTNYLSMISGLMHPLSRGTIHINTTNPLAYPIINPHYLSFTYDLHSMRAFAQISVEVSKHQPLAGLLTQQIFPPPNAMDKAGLESYVASTCISGSHLAGTAAMANRDLGGVVDANLRVYGTSNLRIVDASIMPMIIGAHLQATVYAISEKAADMIKSGR